MKLYKFKAKDTFIRLDDAYEVRKKLATIGISVTPEDAHRAWEAYSDSMSAGWMAVWGSPHDIWAAIEPFMEEVHD